MCYNHIIVQNDILVHELVFSVPYRLWSSMCSSKLAFKLQNTKAGEPIGSVCVSPALGSQEGQIDLSNPTPAFSR